MSTDSSTSVRTRPPVPPPPPAKGRQPQVTAEEFIERQLSKTRRQVKLVDAASVLMTLATSVLAYLLVLALVDHWLFDLGFWGRLLSLVVLILGIAWQVITRLLPLFLQRVNPIYAARAIEQNEPSLKNSLINFLLFRARRSEVNQVVYQALQVQAASDLTRVPVDATVDRTQVIRVGYLLTAVFASAALYTVFSPKDPLQTVQRVAAPWRAIERPARVEFVEILPGDVSVFQGDSVSVTTRVAGIKAGEQVLLVYSTRDRQIVAEPQLMQQQGSDLRYQASLPPNSTGCQQDLIYWIEAGDAVSAQYEITVSPAPTIVVESVEYDFPDYTARANETVRDQGDIRALEGTRVTVRARTNQPIRSAQLEFDPLSVSSAGPGTVLGMEFEDRAARASFTLQLQADRRTPLHGTYQLQYVTSAGHTSQQPVLHRIEVMPDFGPELEILTPTRIRSEVHENGSQRIEIRAVDPDYGLTRIGLRAVAGDTELLNRDLLSAASGRLGQTIVNFDFRPARFGLEEGDRVVFWAIAEDNRQVEALPSPNTQRTRNYELHVIGKQTGQTVPSESADRSAANDQETPPPADRRPKEQQDAEGNAGESPQTDGSTGTSEEGNSSQQQQGGMQSGGSAGDESGEAADQGAPGAGDSQSEGPQDGDPSGAAGQGEPAADGSRSGRQSTGESPAGSDSAPLHDGDVFERLLERLQEQQDDQTQTGNRSGQGTPGEQRSPGGGESPSSAGNTGGEQGPAGQQDGTTLKDPSTQSGGQKPSSGEAAEPSDAEGGPQHPDANQGPGSQKQGAPGEGGTSASKAAEPDRGEKPEVGGEPDRRSKEPGMGDNGDSGAGQNSRDTSGSGSVDMSQDQAVENQDRRQSMNPDNSRPQPEGEPGTTNSRRQSDTEGGASGDQSGGGEKGAGQGANQSGNDSAGRNTSSDDGAGASTESGVGETADSPGQRQRANRPTGSTGSEQGDGSGRRTDPQGQRSGADSPQPPTDRAEQPPPGERQPGDATAGGSGSGQGGGLPSNGQPTGDVASQTDVQDGDQANLEYARRATNMVLQHLNEQRDKPDNKLLDNLGWTKNDLQQFLDRWQKLRQSAREDPAARHELDETLRSLGLRPPRDQLRQGTARDDQLDRLRESAEQSLPPAAYQRQFKAFKKGGDPNAVRK